MELGIAAGVFIIILLEVSRYLRSVKKNQEEIQDLKTRITRLENLLEE